MVDNAIKFRLVENLPFHLHLEKLATAGSEPVCASMRVVFQKLEQDLQLHRARTSTKIKEQRDNAFSVHDIRELASFKLRTQ